jgi:hypothetical protein
MTKFETTCAIFFIGTLFTTKFVLNDNELTSISCIFIIGYLLHFIITKFESNSGTELVQQIDETKLYKNFNQTLNNIPIVIDNSNLLTFEEFLSKCDATLYKQFYNECFYSDCYDAEKYYLKHQKHFSNLFKTKS